VLLPLLIVLSALPFSAAVAQSPAAATPAVTSVSIPVGVEPEAVALDSATDQVFVADGLTDAVAVIDGETNTVTATIPLGLGTNAGSGSIAVDDSTDMVYATDANRQDVSVIDGATDTLVANVPIADGAFSVAVDSTRNLIYVGGLDNDASVLDGATDEVTATFDVPEGIAASAVDAATDTIYFGGSDGVSVVDGATDAVVATTPPDEADGDATGIDLDPSTGNVYISELVGNVAVLDMNTCDSTDQSNCTPFDIPAGHGPADVAVDTTTSSIFVADAGSASDNGGPPRGVVSVKAGSVTLCTFDLSTGKGSCSPTAKALSVGPHLVSAVYAGSTNFAGSASADKSVTVRAA
jgi:YVTN family beta-propeller protein